MNSVSKDQMDIKTPPKIRSGDKLAVGIVIPEGSGKGLKQAADELMEAFMNITGTGIDKRMVESF